LVERLGLEGSGGLVRLGLTHYNTADEVEKVLDALGQIATEARADGQGLAGSRIAAAR
jgi:selenocysteine lyase/cysteine desulfurase